MRPQQIRRRTKLFAASVALFATLGLAACTTGPQPGPTAIPLQPTEAADFEVADIEALMDEMVAAGAPAVLVEVRDGEQVWVSAEGVRSTVSELPAQPADHVRIASLTKPMIAAMVLQLVAEGELELDDPIEDYLPGLVAGRDVSVRQLLNHTSGMPDYVPALALGEPSEITMTIVNDITHEEIIELSRTRPWSFAPGTGFEYSNTNYIALSMLIEELTGNALAQELATRITEPLGLADTSIPNGNGMDGDAFSHGYVIEDPLAIDVTEQNASLWSGAGGVVSTVSDVNTFMRALLTGAVVPPELLGEALVLEQDGYGLGVQGRVDACPDPETAYLLSSAAANEATESPEPTPDGDSDTEFVPDFAPEPVTPVATPDFGFEPRAEGSGSLHESDFGELVQIGEPGYVYGHLGSGLGYRAITMSSPDGIRQVTVSWTVSPTDYAADPRLPLAYELVDVALARDC